MNPTPGLSQAIRNFNSGRGAGIDRWTRLHPRHPGHGVPRPNRQLGPQGPGVVKKWFQDYLHWLTTSDNANNEKHAGDNHASWWTAQVAAIATFVEDEAQEKAAFNYYRDHIFPRQIKSDGSAPREEARTRSLWYSAFNLEALTTTCRIAQIQGVDLWTAHGKGGATIATVIEYLQPFLSDPKKWTKDQITDFSNDGLYFLAYAGMG